MSEMLIRELLEELRVVAASSRVISTVADGKPNWITSVAEEGVYLETEASRAKGYKPQLIPAWMLNTAWHHLRTSGALDNRFLLSTEGLRTRADR